MSLIVYGNRVVNEAIPQGVELRPSDFNPKITDIPVSFLFEVIAGTFNCAIDYCNSQPNISEIKLFVLGEEHGSELIKNVHTTLLRLLIKDGDCIGHEGESDYGRIMHKNKDATDMIDGWALQRDVNYWSWEMEGLEEQFQFPGKMMHRACLNLEKMEKSLDKYKNYVVLLSKEQQKIYQEALKYIRNEVANSGEFQITEPLLALHQKSQTAKSPLVRALLGMSYVSVLALATYAQSVEKTFEPRQECLSEDIEDMSGRPVNSFFLCGKAHVLEEDGEIEHNISPALEGSGVGYLASRIFELAVDEEEAHAATMNKGHLVDLRSQEDGDFANYEVFDHINDRCRQLISVAAQHDPKISNEFLALYESLFESVVYWT